MSYSWAHSKKPFIASLLTNLLPLVAGFTVLVYDTFLSFSDEFEFVWRPLNVPLSRHNSDIGRQRVALRLLYVISRYTMLAISTAFLFGILFYDYHDGIK